MNEVQKSYRKAMAALGSQGRVQRTAELFEAGCAMMEARALRQDSQLDGVALKLATARLLYRKDRKILQLLDEYESSHAV
jgi:hypothetical protein